MVMLQPHMFQLISSETNMIWFIVNEVINSYCKLVKDPFILLRSLLEKEAAAAKGCRRAVFG